MISFIIQSYFAILLSIGLGALFIFIMGLYFIFKRPAVKIQKAALAPSVSETPTDFSAIAGDDIVTTQLDLARAYMETGKKQSAKDILESVIAQGSFQQQEEARRLLASVCSE